MGGRVRGMLREGLQGKWEESREKKRGKIRYEKVIKRRGSFGCKGGVKGVRGYKTR